VCTPFRSLDLHVRAIVAAETPVENIVVQQAAQIAELRAAVEEMQKERAELRAAGVVDDFLNSLDQKGKEVSDAARVPAATSRPPKRSSAMKAPVYKLFGKLPADFDGRPSVERLIERRVSARLKKHYGEADRLQRRLLRMGVKLDDRRKTWSLRPGWEAMQASLSEEDQQSWRQQQLLQSDLEMRIKKLFLLFDEDGNGLIDCDEFRITMDILAIPGSREEHDKLFDEWDADGSGGINLKEIRQALIAAHKDGGDEVPLLKYLDDFA